MAAHYFVLLVLHQGADFVDDGLALVVEGLGEVGAQGLDVGSEQGRQRITHHLLHPLFL